MSKGISFLLGISLVGFLACGGGGGPKIPPPPDAQNDTSRDVIEARDPGIHGDVVDADEKAVGHDGKVLDGENVTHDDGVDVSDDGIVPGDDGINSETTNDSDIDSSIEDGVSRYVCKCDETDNKHPVCGLNPQKTYPNDPCAVCGQCAGIKGYDECIGCKGTIKNCDLDDSTTYLFKKAACDVCVCSSKERKSGKVCGACTGGDCCNIIGLGSSQIYSTLCEFKLANNCPADPTASDKFFSMGECVCSSCTVCASKPKDPVCGLDGNTYPNKCWLTNCPEGNNNRVGCGAPCLDTAKCAKCAGTSCGEVCAEVDNNGTKTARSFYNECEATCEGATIKYKGHCCPNCQGLPDKPVCAKDGDGKLWTLANSCELSCSGYTKLYDGQCTDNTCAQGDCTCSCEGVKNCSCDCSKATGADLVCGGESGTTWPSQCWLDYLGLKKVHDGKCTTECEKCATSFTPVCAADNKTYANECFAKCKGTTKQFDGVCSSCESLCGTPASPKDPVNHVCGADGIAYPTFCFPNTCTHVTYKGGNCG